MNPNIYLAFSALCFATGGLGIIQCSSHRDYEKRITALEQKSGPAQKTSSETGTTALAPSSTGQPQTVSIRPVSSKEIYHKTLTLDMQEPETKEGVIYNQNLETGAVRSVIRSNGKVSTRVDYLNK